MTSHVVKISVVEVRAIAKWVEDHNQAKHDGQLDNADIAVRNLDGSIGTRTIVTCEACERVRVANENHCDVTDYDCF